MSFMQTIFKVIFIFCFVALCAHITLSSTNTFPIVKNKAVLQKLKKFKNSKHMKTCLKNMARYKKVITKKLDKHKLPHELLAIPIVESCYENIHSKNGWGSGIWMLVKPTAKSLGLKVTSKTDERLNIEKSTDAALKYLKRNHKLFKDWQLTIMAYNMGENAVLDAIKKTKSRDPWKLIHKGYERDKGYLAKVMATAIVINAQDD